MIPESEPEERRHEDDTHNQGGEADERSKTTSESQSLTVVGIGASAGGLPALQALFDALPRDTGMAFVVVTHMDPERESHLPALLQSHTSMPVQQVQGLLPVQTDNVYVIPPNCHIHMTDTHLDVEQFEQPRSLRAPIDHFFRSLAHAHPEAIAVILSGGGTDGAVGVKAIKERGGLLMVQDPHEAEYTGMPHAAINTGLADVVLPISKLAEKLITYRQNGVRLPLNPGALTVEETEAVYRILTQVQVRTGHDFSQYKRSTILRRIQRRMQLHGYATLDVYLSYLRHDAAEAQALFNDLLIGVTNFFRDREAWDTLTETVVPRLFEDKQQGDTVRVWTIGCATGEEAYSVAMLLMEYLDSMDKPPAARPAVQVFASDLDDDALLKAREGLYPQAIETDVSPQRLERFFVKDGNYYRVRRELRDIVLFSNHSVLRDPPFSRLDLISCRNLLIYLQRDVQENVFQIFHYALNPERYLFLGSSESAEMVHELFHTVDKSNRIYQARLWRGGQNLVPTLPLSVRNVDQPVRTLRQSRSSAKSDAALEAQLHREALEEFAPPSVLVDETYHVLHISDRAGRYLRHPGGTLTGDLLKLVRSELRYELRRLLYTAFEGNELVIGAPIYVQFNGAPRRVIVAVRPRDPGPAIDPEAEKDEPGSRLALIFFLEDQSRGEDYVPEAFVPAAESDEEGAARDSRLMQLDGEVQRLRERLQATVEEYESSNEELKAANEELQSMNEEYRSTTEELETSKEELQSVNEELQTVNAELKNKLEEISRAHSDLENLMAVTDVATLFLDRNLHINRYTPGTVNLFNIMGGDRGRPLSHLTNRLEYEGLEADARRVLESLQPVEREVQQRTGDGHERRWYLVRIRPYRTVDDRIDGVVITFVDITNTKRTEQALEATRERYRLMVESTKEYAMFTMDAAGRIEMWNQGAQRTFGYDEEEVKGETADIIFTPEDRVAGDYREEMRMAREDGQAGNERWHVRKDGSRFWASGVVTSLWDGERLRGYAKVLRDNTARKEHEEALQESKDALEALNETLEQKVHARTESLQQRTEEVRQLAARLAVAEQEERSRVAQVLHDDLQQRLYAIQLQLEFLESAGEKGDADAFRDELVNIKKELEHAIRTTRQLNVDLSPPILHDEGLPEAIDWLVRQMEEQHGLQVNLDAQEPIPIYDDGLRVLLFQAVRELLFNVVKHAGVLNVDVALRLVDDELIITVIDYGIGFDADVLNVPAKSGTGLATIRRRLSLVGGSMTVESREGDGAKITLLAPLELSGKNMTRDDS